MARKAKDKDLVLSLAAFAPALARLNKFSADRDIVPGLRQLWFSGRTMRASTGTYGAVLTTEWEFPEEFALPAAALAALVDSLHGQGHEAVTFEPREASFLIRSDGFRATLGRYKPTETEDLSAYLTRNVPGEGDRPAVTPQWWAELERMLFTVCRDETKAPLRGVQWSRSGALYSTDAYRITALEPEARVAAPSDGGLLLPEPLLDRLGSQRRDVTAMCLEEGNTLWMFGPAFSVFGSLFAAGFPESGCDAALRAAREAAKSSGAWVQLPAGPALASVLDRLLYFAEPPTYRVTGKVVKGSLVLKTSAGSNEVEEHLPAQVKGSSTLFAVNGKYLRDAITMVGARFWAPPEGGNALYFPHQDGRLSHLVILLH